MVLDCSLRTLRGVAFRVFLYGAIFTHNPIAQAHAEHGSESGTPKVSAKSPMPTGVSLAVAKSTGFQFLLSTDGKQTVEVLADDGKPFLRIHNNTANANVSSVAWHRAQQPGGGAVPPAIKQGQLPEQWVLVQQTPGLGWFDPRLNNEEVPSFVLKLRTGKKVWPIRIERKADAVLSGFWQPVLQQEPDIEGFSALIPGLSGNAIMLTHTQQSQAPLQVLDDQNTPFLRMGSDGIWLDTSHPWAPELGLFPPSSKAGERWVKLSDSSTITYTDPRLKHTGTNNNKKTSQWTIPLRASNEKPVLVIGGQLVWRSTSQH